MQLALGLSTFPRLFMAHAAKREEEESFFYFNLFVSRQNKLEEAQFSFLLLVTLQESQTGNVSTSVLRLTPRVHDHGKHLTCRTSNSRVPGFAMEDTWKMTVFCKFLLPVSLLFKPVKALGACNMFIKCARCIMLSKKIPAL